MGISDLRPCHQWKDYLSADSTPSDIAAMLRDGSAFHTLVAVGEPTHSEDGFINGNKPDGFTRCGYDMKVDDLHIVLTRNGEFRVRTAGIYTYRVVPVRVNGVVHFGLLCRTFSGNTFYVVPQVQEWDENWW